MSEKVLAMRELEDAAAVRRRDLREAAVNEFSSVEAPHRRAVARQLCAWQPPGKRGLSSPLFRAACLTSAMVISSPAQLVTG